MSGDVIFTRAFLDTGPEVRAEDLLKDKSLPVPFIASTEGVKSDGKDLRMSDWNLARYENYGPVIWVHDYTHPPLGTGTARVDDKLRIDVTFDTDDPFAMMIRSKSLKGMMAGSVGWRTMKGGGNELFEFTMAPVPIDPDSMPDIQRMGMRAMQIELAQALGEDAEADSSVIDLIQAVRVDIMTEIQSLLSQLVDSETEGEVEEPVEDPVEDGDREEDEPEVIEENPEPEIEDLEEEIDEEEDDEEDGRAEWERAGAALSRKNTDDLTQALVLINGVLERATPTGDGMEDPFRSENEEPVEADEDVDQRGDTGSELGEEPPIDPDVLNQIKEVLNKEQVL